MTNPNPVAPKTDWAKKDREEGQRYIDAFIETVNADHMDVIPVNRDIGCLMRNEIERLRKAERVAPKTDTPATQMPEQLPEHQARVSRDSTLGSHMCSCGFGYPGISYEEWMRHYVRELESTLAAERASRLQADTEQFNAGIEAALNPIAYYIDTRNENDETGAWEADNARLLSARIVSLKRPSVSPEQAEEKQ